MRPRFLYKFRPIDDHTKRVFSHNELHITAPIELNDPFECQADITVGAVSADDRRVVLERVRVLHPELTPDQATAFANRIIREPADSGAAKEMRELAQARFRAEAGILSLTERNDDILMWSHYADKHQGICVQFEVDVDSDLLAQARRVVYQESLPCVELFRSSPPEMVQAALLTKASHWSYEREWRVIVPGTGTCNRTFAEEALSGVILGAQVSDASRCRVLRWLEGRRRVPTILRAVKSRGAYSLDLVPVDGS